MNVLDFLHTIITQPTHEPAYLRVFVRGKGDTFLRWPLSERVEALSTPDSFFSPILYQHDDLQAPLLSTHIVSIDAGEADLVYLPLTPYVVVETSYGRHQVYFRFAEAISSNSNESSSSEYEYIATQIATSLDQTDLLSVKPGYLMRVPNTYNMKYPSDRSGNHQLVTITSTNDTINKVENLLPSPNGVYTYTQNDMAAAFRLSDDATNIKPLHFIEDILELSPLSVAEYTETSENPKRSLERFVLECLRKGVPTAIIYTLATGHACNYMSKYKYNGDVELKKLILRLQAHASVVDPKDLIERIRNQAQTMEQRQEGVARIVEEHMRATGTFINMRDGEAWYVPTSRQPIPVDKRSARLVNYLNREFNINSTSPEAQHTSANLEAFADSLPPVGDGTTLSHYDRSANRLLINTGANQLHSITSTSITQVPNGSYNKILFPLNSIFLPFLPRERKHDHKHTPAHWSEVVFGPFLDKILTLDHEEARAILTAWFMFLFFKNDAAARPILALIAPPGSGKSTIMKRVCTLLYGKVSGFMSISTRDDFDQITSTYPLIVIDNLDTWEKWIPDALAQSAAAIDRGKKRLYTNNELFIYHRDAMVALTAHDPKFSRADVADRLLILPMTRIQSFVPEGELLQLDRAGIWYDIFQDLQRVLQTTPPSGRDTEQLRIMDFSSIGGWITAALGLHPQFNSAISKLRGQQKAFALDSDQLLVKAILEYTKNHKGIEDYHASSQLYLWLEKYAGQDSLAFSKKYRSAQALGNRLYTLQDALRALVDIDWQPDNIGRRTWRIRAKSSA